MITKKLESLKKQAEQRRTLDTDLDQTPYALTSLTGLTYEEYR